MAAKLKNKMSKISLSITDKKKLAEVSGKTHFYCFKPAWLLHLVVDDRLILIDALVSGSREDHILDKEIKKKHTNWLSGCSGIYL